MRLHTASSINITVKPVILYPLIVLPWPHRHAFGWKQCGGRVALSVRRTSRVHVCRQPIYSSINNCSHTFRHVNIAWHRHRTNFREQNFETVHCAPRLPSTSSSDIPIIEILINRDSQNVFQLLTMPKRTK